MNPAAANPIANPAIPYTNLTERPGEGTTDLLGERSVEDSISSIFIVKSHTTTENTTKLDVFAEEESSEELRDGRVNGYFLSLARAISRALLIDCNMLIFSLVTVVGISFAREYFAVEKRRETPRN